MYLAETRQGGLPGTTLVLSFGHSGHEVGLSAFVEQAGELEFA